MTLGTLELAIILLFTVSAVIGSVLVKKLAVRYFKLVRTLLFGIAGILLIVGLITPPDIISNFLLSIPAIIIYATIVIIKYLKALK